MNNSTKIWLAPPDLNSETPDYISKVLQKGWVAPNGPENKKFEQLIGEFLGFEAEQVVSCSSGTAALHLVYRALNFQKNEVVFLPTLNFVAALNPLLMESAKPWFIDSEEETGGISPELLEQAVLEAQEQELKPRAVVVVHLLGFPAKMKQIREIADRFNLVLIEDAAESLGAKINGEFTQKFADFSVMSFNGNKTITTSGGGSVIAKSVLEAREVRLFRDHVKQVGLPYYWHEKPGFNYALSNISAAIGVSEWKTVSEKLQKKEQIRNWYEEAFQQQESIHLYPIHENNQPSFWLNCIFLEESKRAKVYQALADNEIESRYLWTPLHLMPFAKDFPRTLNGTSEKWAKTGICLPSGTGLTEEQVIRISEYVIQAAKS
ncbi:DegT/DnrJ/EryC1/StrS family aminotransferase [bacterium]|nr:MAG: DegT/DnrJ/EryC1/StrS family aminotransferase [bacterium]